MWNSTIDYVWNSLTQFKLFWFILKSSGRNKCFEIFIRMIRWRFRTIDIVLNYLRQMIRFLCYSCFCVIDLQRTRCLQLSNFKAIVIALFWLAILSHSMYTYRCNKSFCIWMTIFPKGLPNLFSILKPNILTEVRLTNGVTNRSK